MLHAVDAMLQFVHAQLNLVQVVLELHHAHLQSLERAEDGGEFVRIEAVVEHGHGQAQVAQQHGVAHWDGDRLGTGELSAAHWDGGIRVRGSRNWENYGLGILSRPWRGFSDGELWERREL